MPHLWADTPTTVPYNLPAKLMPRYRYHKGPGLRSVYDLVFRTELETLTYTDGHMPRHRYHKEPGLCSQYDFVFRTELESLTYTDGHAMSIIPPDSPDLRRTNSP